MRKHLLLLSVMLTMAALPAFAQNVTGRVTSGSDNSALPGVSVVVKGSTRGTATDSDGNYTLAVGGESDATLVISFIGYATQEVPVQGRTTIDVVLQEDISQLGEVVITGFGEKKDAARISYATQEVKGGDLTRANTGNPINALQGKVAGVMIDQGTGGPASSSRIRVRGNASLNANTQPLFVVDGVLIRPTQTGADSWGAAQDNGNIMKNINPDNIESMTVLKGSAASALYGSGALYGVVLITTKKGTLNKGIGVTYSHTSSFEKAYKYIETQDEFGGGVNPTFSQGADGVNEIDRTVLGSGTPARYYSYGPKLDGSMVRDADGRMVKWEANNPLDFFETGHYTNHNVVLEGGTENSTIRASYSNLRNTSIMPNGTEMMRNNFSVNFTQKLGKLFDIAATVDYTRNNIDNPIRQGGNSNPVFQFVYYRPRHLDIDYWTNNYIDPVNGGAKTGLNAPYGMTGAFFWDTFQDNVERTENVFRTNIDINTHITPWLSLLVRGNVQDEQYYDERKRLGSGTLFNGGAYSVTEQSNRQYRVQTLLTATRQLNPDLFLSATIGGEYNKTDGGRYYKAYTRDNSGGESNTSLRLPGVFALANGLGGTGITTRMTPSRLLNAFYAYGDLTYKEQLTFNFSFRQDYASTLKYSDGTGDYAYNYPAVGLAWEFTETFQNLPSVISFGKLRANFGMTGGDTDPYTINETGSYETKPEYIGPNGSVTYIGFRDNALANKSLKALQAREWEVGADIRFFDNRIGLDFAYYNKLTKNEIFRVPTSIESGVSERVVNGGEISNKGIEIMLRATPVKTSEWEWTTMFNYTRNRNEILSLPDGVKNKQLSLAFGADMYSIAQPGLQYGTIATPYGYAFYQAKDGEGNNIDSPSNGKRVIGAANTQNGYSYLRSSQYGQGDRILGTSMEKYLLSNINTVSFKNFTLNVQVDAKVGGMMASATHAYGSSSGSLANSLFGRDLAHGGVEYIDANGETRYDGIIPDGVLADGIKADNDASIDLGGMSYAEAVESGYLKPVAARDYYENLTQWSSGIREYSVFENSWVSLREVSLGYNVPAAFASKLKLQRLRFNVTGRNLAYLYTTAPLDINPEGLKSNNAGEFAEYGGLPMTRQWGVSVTAGF